MGNFGGLEEYTLRQGNVVFRGWDATRTEGLYYVPASGGAVTKIVTLGDPLDNGRTVIGNGGGFYQPPIQEQSPQLETSSPFAWTSTTRTSGRRVWGSTW